MTLDELIEKLLELRKHEEGYTPVIFAHGAFETRWPVGLPIRDIRKFTDYPRVICLR